MVSRNLLKIKRESEISLEMPQWKRASSRVEWTISCFFSSFDSKFGIHLELRRGPHGPSRRATGKSSVYASCDVPLGIPL